MAVFGWENQTYMLTCDCNRTWLLQQQQRQSFQTEPSGMSAIQGQSCSHAISSRENSRTWTAERLQTDWKGLEEWQTSTSVCSPAVISSHKHTKKQLSQCTS